MANKKDVDAFLEKIGQIESAGGKYTNHVTLDKGMHKGQSAYGTWGLMPKTVQELARTSSSPELRALQGKSEQDVETLLKTKPELERALARQLAEHVLSRQGGDEQKAAYTWYNGHNLSPESVEKRGYMDHDYVKKFNKLAGLTGKTSTIAMPAGGGRSPARDTVDFNRGQSAETDAALAAMTGGAAPIVNSASQMMTPVPVEQEEELKPVQVKAPQVSTEMPRFGAINQLIASYYKGKR